MFKQLRCIHKVFLLKVILRNLTRALTRSSQSFENLKWVVHPNFFFIKLLKLVSKTWSKKTRSRVLTYKQIKIEFAKGIVPFMVFLTFSFYFKNVKAALWWQSFDHQTMKLKNGKCPSKEKL